MKPAPFLALLCGYTSTQLALYNHTTCLEAVTIDNKKVSKMLIPELDALLKRNNMTLNDCQFIAALQGPAPFNTLRVVLATVNALSYATKIPLIGVDGLESLVLEHADDMYDYTIALLNAFADDVYFAINKRGSGIIVKGCMNINEFIKTHTVILAGSSLFMIGNGVVLHESILHEAFAITIPSEMPLQCSLKALVVNAIKIFESEHDSVYQLYPLYLKSPQVYKPAPGLESK